MHKFVAILVTVLSFSIDAIRAQENVHPNIVVILADDKYVHEPDVRVKSSQNMRFNKFIERS